MLVLGALIPAPAAARRDVGRTGGMELAGQLLVERVVAAEVTGMRRIVQSQAEARSGDRLIFLIRYRNSGVRALPGYDIIAPVPSGVRILPDRNDTLRVSADGGRNWARPDAAFSFDVRGHLRPLGDLRPTHVRLRLDRPIAPGESGTVAYRGHLL